MKAVRKIFMFAFWVTLCLVVSGFGSAWAAGNDRAGSLVFVRGNEVWFADSHGRGQKMLKSLRNLDYSPPALSADGSLAAVAAGVMKHTGMGNIQYISVSTGEAKALRVDGVYSADNPSFAPDGLSLAFVAAFNPQMNRTDDLDVADMAVVVAPVRGGRPKVVVMAREHILDAGYAFAGPVISPDGTMVAYQEVGSDVSGGFVVRNLKSGREVFRFPMDKDDYTPYWRPQFTPDGRSLLCYSPAVDLDAKSLIQLVDMPSGRKTVLTRGATPTFVDRGRAIVFERPVPGGARPGSELWRLDLTPGAGPERIVRNGRAPAGQPCTR